MVENKKSKVDIFLDRYGRDPIGFQLDCLDVEKRFVWPKMVEVAESVRDYQKTCVYAGHSVSKTYEAARLALWFLYTHKPSTVITTAPIYDLVEKVIWKEIHTAHTNARIALGGNMTKTQLDIDPDRKWFAYGFACKPDTVTQEATAVQGKHNDYVLIILDEAAGIMSQIWRAAESLLVDRNCKILAIGNPTSSSGSFIDCGNDPSWHCITISVKDTPNFIEGRDVIPGVSGRGYEEMIRNKYGEESNEYGIRVLGRKPEWTQGTYLGQWCTIAEKEGRIGDIVWEVESPVYTVWDYGHKHNAIWFIQFIKNQINFIDFFYDHEGKGLPFYASVIQNKGYVYGGHYAPPDVWGSNAKSGQTGLLTVDVAKALKLNFIKINAVSVQDRIGAAQGIMPKCHFSESCREGFEGLRNWRQKKNEQLSTPDKPVYHKEAIRDWTCHVGDSFSEVAVVYRTMSIGGKRIGFTIPVKETEDIENRKEFNPLKYRTIRRKVG